MTTAFFDCYNGISGNMVLGALVDLGLDSKRLEQAVRGLGIGGFEIAVSRVKRCGIAATLLQVKCDEYHSHRGFSDIVRIIEAAELTPRVKERAIAAFRLLGEAEAEVHEVPLEQIHFHEVGAVDAIVDIVGAMWALDELGIGKCLASAVVVGSGTVRTAHGEMPVPAPATALILRGVSTAPGPIAAEMTTPTGAAILRTVCESFGSMGEARIEKIGYGAGSREHRGHTNYLRVMLGSEALAGELPIEARELAVIQTEIDDMPGEVFGHLMERLFEAGCLDAHFAQVQMKKNRPGVSVQVLAAPERVPVLLELLLRETSTFGAKVIPCRRYCLPRRMEQIETPLGSVRVKLGFWGDQVIKATPEYEDCRRIAAERSMPIAAVFAAVNATIVERGANKK